MGDSQGPSWLSLICRLSAACVRPAPQHARLHAPLMSPLHVPLCAMGILLGGIDQETASQAPRGCGQAHTSLLPSLSRPCGSGCPGVGPSGPHRPSPVLGRAPLVPSPRPSPVCTAASHPPPFHPSRIPFPAEGAVGSPPGRDGPAEADFPPRFTRLSPSLVHRPWSQEEGVTARSSSIQSETGHG